MPDTVKLALQAMATRFEFILHGEDERQLRAAGEEAMDEILRLEMELGFYQSASEITALNTRAADGPVRISPMLFGLLEQCAELSRQSDGCFDITVAPLMKCWGLAGDGGRFPEADELDAARSVIGMDLLELNRSDYTVRFKKPGVMLDLGSIGKGFALDIAAEWLRDAGIESGLIHGGTSTTCAIGRPPDQDAWRVAIVKPEAGPSLLTGSDATADQLLASVELVDESLSVSAVWGKSFELNGRTYGHVIDPRSGHPVSGACLAAVILPTATETDALSTALLTLGSGGHARLAEHRPAIRSLIALPDESEPGYRVERNGI